MPPLLGDRDLNAAHVGENDTASFKMPKSASDTQVAQKELRAKEIAALQLGGDGSKISPGKMARRSMQPRKSILKPLGRSESDDTLTFNHTGSFGRVSNVSGSMHDRGEHTVSFPARRVSFAPNAHVRMFENQTKPKRKSIAFAPPPPAPTDAPAGTGAGSSGQARRQSRGSASHSRQASITDLSTIHLPPSLTAGPAAPRASIAPRSSLAAAIPDRFVGEGDSLGEEAMDISVSDAGDVTVEDAGEGDESGEVSMEISDGRSMILPSYTAPIPRPPFALGARTSTGARLSLSRSNSDDSVSVPNAAARSSIGASGMRQSIGGGIDEEEAMDLTVAMGGILPSAPADASFEGEGEGDTTIISASTDPDAERTMEFTIAVGGIMPSTPPTHAARGGRVSLGYSNPGHDASLQRLVPGQSMEGDEEDDEEVGMEETVAFGGILRDGQDDTMSSEEGDNVAGRERERTQTFNFGSNEVSLGHKQIQLPEVEADMSVDMADEDDEDDEEGMEITEAHGGILRRQSMVTATANHTHASSSGHTASLSMVSSTTRNIFAPVSPAYIAPTSGPIGTPSRHLTSSHNTGTPSFARPTVSSARKSRPSLSSTHLSAENIHARAETSLSGNGKEKRNVFAPSPSPTKKSTTPRKSIGAGAAAARDVAKRLSFAPSNIHMGGIGQESGSPEKSVRPIMLDEFGNEYDAEMSVGRKRKADEDRTPSSTPASVRRKVLGGGAVVVQRVENVFAPNGNVFAPATSTNPKPVNASASAVAPAQGTPRKSLPAHMYLASIGQSPAKSPMLRKMIGAAPSASAVEDEDEAELVSGDRRGNANEHEQVIGQEERQEEEEGEGDFQPIPLSAFLEMADIRFTMDDVGVSGVSGPSRKSMGARARQSYTGKFIFMSCEREFALHEYAAASVQNGFVNMYTWACSKMRADISASTSEISSIEADCAIFNPPVIREYLGATDDDKQLFEMTFKQYRANQQLIARGRFYAWKLDMLTRVGPDVEGVLEGMREDKARLDEMQQTTTRLLPELQAKLAALQEDLVREREAVKEIEACDAGELEGLRESITEQNGFLKALETDVSESASSLSRLETTLADLATSKTEHLSAITTARGLCDQYTKSDVLRLRDELHAVQAMHRWEIESVDEGLLRVVYDREVVLTVPLTQTAQAVQGKEEEGRVEFRNEKEGDEVMRGLKEVFGSAVRVLKVRGLGVSRYIQQVGQLYASICRIRSEIRLLNVHFPITTVLHTLNDATNTAVFEVRASVMFTELRSRVEVVFAYDEGVLKAWPEGVATGQVWVERVYGAADPETLTAVARDVMSTATPEGYFGYMVQTCVDVSTS